MAETGCRVRHRATDGRGGGFLAPGRKGRARERHGLAFGVGVSKGVAPPLRWFAVYAELQRRILLPLPTKCLCAPSASLTCSLCVQAAGLQVNVLPLPGLQICDMFGWTECSVGSSCSCSFSLFGFLCLWWVLGAYGA